MAETATATNINERRVLKSNVMLIEGRIENVRRMESGNGYSHAVRVPAIDEFSFPGIADVRSEAKLGDKGEHVKVEVALNGSIRRFKYADKETGEEKKGVEVKSWFTAIE